ncbi:hypothetical protein N7449_008871 [Penicillium cf. viridicatum]|uniref:Apple domain-containing protein n=1 Tax=Penicillium cf. viridicatum TaxID=2972119 RepID=A0A9W9M8J8_9EURO|nr:hypothetical protein N7449_008871 [Penicillium cf. viridicatum]
MDGLEVAPEQHREAGRYDNGPEVVPDTEKEARRDTGGLHYVSGPTSASPGILEDGSLKTKPPKERKRICGVTSTVFWLLVVIAILVIGGAVGGGVGGSLANKKTTTESNLDLDTTSTASTQPQSSTSATTSSSTTTTASTTSSAPVTSGTIGVAANPCPGQNLTTETGSDGSVFTLLCAVDWPSGGKSGDGSGTVKDLSTTTEYTLKSCIAECVQWNEDTSNDPQCKGVVYSANLTASFDGGQGGNCFLKSNVGRYFPNSNTSMAAGLLGG